MTNGILVTGAFGQVGRRTTELLLSRGHTVIATDQDGERAVRAANELARQEHPGTLKIAYADLLDERAISDLVALHRPDAILHLAGILAPLSYRNPRLARAVNVDGTANLVRAAQSLAVPPFVVFASSAAVYGSRNPARQPERITSQTPLRPVDHYGEDKAIAEAVIKDSGLPHVVLRLGGVISPAGTSGLNVDHLVMMRALPGDNQMHTVDARDVATALANAVDRRHTVGGKALPVAGNDTHLHTYREVEDDLLEAVGVGRLGPRASLPGDRSDDRGWGPTGLFDTTESQALLSYHDHDWSDTVAWVAQSQPRYLRRSLRVAGPILRHAMLATLVVQRKVERRGAYANPWRFIAGKYGPDVLAQGDRSPRP